MLTSRPRGTNDILPGDVERWQYIEALAHELCRNWCYGELRTPVFEHTELFLRGVGDATDIVEKEMYTFQDKGGRSLTLRPEGTAPAARAYLENRLQAGPQPVKLYYIGPMFRHDRPQAGRFRQFHQFGAEIFGAAAPAADAEIITLAMEFYRSLDITGLELHLNSVGCPMCRQVLRERLRRYFEARMDGLCPHCRGRLERNPLRLLDCKEAGCREAGAGAPTPLDCLCDECRAHFAEVRRTLDIVGVSYVIDPRLVRGLDYYTRTAFEILAAGVGAQSAVGGGGRYDGLVRTVGGPGVPGVGVALGLERTLLLLAQQHPEVGGRRPPDAFLATAGNTWETATALLVTLRRSGVACDHDYTGRSLKAQMKHAGRLGARFVVIVGEDEAARGAATVRDMESGRQEEVALNGLAPYLRQRLAEKRPDFPGDPKMEVW
ncbi:MAG: histidine--tRNA ligase [Thermoanaerobacterales bacterium]|nr:histidine--tRNA ligase [Thermoanaerobacterales bacterium]